MPDDVQVDPSHLDELAGKQQTVSAEITGAVATTAGVEARVATTHGPIAAATYAALHTVQTARGSAGDAMAQRSSALSDRLGGGARRYERTDEALSADYDQMMQVD